MGRKRRKWTAEEDALLRAAVQKAIEESRPLLWRELAKSVPERTNKDCRRRWYNTLSSTMSKGPWTESEDERLWNAVRRFGPKWTRVAAAVGTRNSGQCVSHWSQSLNPEIDYSDWTREEDEKLLLAVEQYGTAWTKIASHHLPGRAPLAVKNRYAALRARSAPRAGALSSDDVRSLSSPRRQSRPQPSPSAYHSSETAGRQGSMDKYDDHEDEDDDDDYGDDDDDYDDDDDDDEGDDENPKEIDSNATKFHQMRSDTTPSYPFDMHSYPWAQPSSTPPTALTTAEKVADSMATSEVFQGLFPYPLDMNLPLSASTTILPGDSDAFRNWEQAHERRDAHPHSYKFGDRQDTTQARAPFSNGRDFSTHFPGDSSPLIDWITDSSGTFVSPSTESSNNKGHSPAHYRHESAALGNPSSGILSRQSSQASGPTAAGAGSPQRTLQRVSIELVCTPDQLSHIVGTLVGVTETITVKVDSWL